MFRFEDGSISGFIKVIDKRIHTKWIDIQVHQLK